MSLSEILTDVITELRCLSRQSILERWQTTSNVNDLTSLQPVVLSDRHMAVFTTEQAYFQQTLTVPATIGKLTTTGATVRLQLTWWAEYAEVFANGLRIAQGDLFDQKQRILLGADVLPEQIWHLEIYLTKPKHDRGALQASDLIWEYPRQPCDVGKFADELAVIQAYLPILSDRNFNLDALEQVTTRLAELLQAGIDDQSLSEITELRRSLLPIGEFLKQRQVGVLGNAHIDVAWLWAIAETKEVMQRTFDSALNLQQQYPELIFNQSTALSYAWMEAEQPDLFARIQTAVAQQQWELTGGMWVEPDCNVPSGESLIRQILYGKRYFLEKFGQDVKVAWLPDTFGFNWQLPQILQKSGFTSFITQKLAWNDTNKFPYQVFWWQGLDGSRILTYFSNDIGTGIEPVDIAKFLVNLEQKHQVNACLWLYGVGDHGGGPTADMLNTAREWRDRELFFTVKPQTAEQFMFELEKQHGENLPIWQDELYLEFHRGTYTTKADQKLKNRRTEVLLGNVEKYRAIASILQQRVYPQAQIQQAWQGLLLNQFHDILPGTSIPEVYEDANQTWATVSRICEELIAEIDRNLNNAPAFSWQLWNFLNWKRTLEIVELETPSLIKTADLYACQSSSYKLFPTQLSANGNLLVIAEEVPSLGWTKLQVVEFQKVQKHPNWILVSPPPLAITESSLENQHLKITIDPNLGQIAQIFDKRYNHALLSKPIEIQFFTDQGQYWDAWNINPQYGDFPVTGLVLESITISERGPLRVALQTKHKFGDSTWMQEIQLDAYYPDVTVKHWVDWQAEGILAKASFAVNFAADLATYEIPMGTIQRSTLGKIPEEKAKWEVPAQFWADLSSEGIGLSILNDCKYGYSAKPSELSLSLLRSPNWPCPHADRGIHEFTYRLLPHQGDWQAAYVVQVGYELNHPLQFYGSMQSHENTLTDALSFLSTDTPQIILTALKLAESATVQSPSWIVRFYEAYGKPVQAAIAFLPKLSSVWECDLMENSQTAIAHQTHQFSCQFQPYEIKTFCITFAN